jgi:predicted TIM-barrel fold metal-dependent hydrolase
MPFDIINAHEHLQSMSVVPKFLDAMAANEIVRTLIVGSPEATILKNRTGFHGEEKYNLETLIIADHYPESFVPFPTINPADNAGLDKLRLYLKNGAKGLKLYSGHSQFHNLPLDHPKMTPVYEFCERERIPILFHVNTGRYGFEFERVLSSFPELGVVCPHLCLSTVVTKRFEHFMSKYPSLWTDISMGYIDFLKEALLRFSARSRDFRDLFVKYQDRIFFGTDNVITDAQYKTSEWIGMMTRVYRDLLEKDKYEFSPLGTELRGLGLPSDVLEKIYRTNFERFLGAF